MYRGCRLAATRQASPRGGLPRHAEGDAAQPWGALVAGVLLLAWAAFRLPGDLGKSARSETGTDPKGEKDQGFAGAEN